MKGFIYAVANPDYTKVYIGSTTSPLNKRVSEHKGSLRDFKLGKIRWVSVMDIIEEGNYEIELVEEYECDDRKQLLIREQFWIDNTVCVNTNRAFKTPEQYKEYRAAYHQEHKEDPEYVSKRVNYVQKPENIEKRRLKANETDVNRRANDPAYAAARTASYDKWHASGGGDKRNAKRREQRAALKALKSGETK